MILIGCGRTPVGQTDPGPPPEEPPVPGDAGPDASEPVPFRCSWDYGPEAVLRELPGSAFEAVGAYVGPDGRSLRILSRPAGQPGWLATDLGGATLAELDRFEVPPAGEGGSFTLETQLFPIGSDGTVELRRVQLASGGMETSGGCVVRRTLRDGEGVGEVLTVRRDLVDCHGYAYAPGALLVVAEGPGGDLSFHPVQARGTRGLELPAPSEVRLADGDAVAGPTFGSWDGADGFQAIQLRADGRLAFLSVVGEELTETVLGTLPGPARLAPDLSAGRSFLLARDEVGRVSVAEADLAAGELAALRPVEPAVDADLTLRAALLIVQNELLVVDRTGPSLRFVPVPRGSVASLPPPAPGARGLRVVVQPSSRRAAVIYGVDGAGGGTSVRVRRLDCRL